MKTKLMILLGMMVLLTSLVGATFVFKQGENVNLKVPIFNNDKSPADSSVSCYITSRYPNESMLIDNQQMAFNIGGYFDYTITELQVNGKYPTHVNCNDTSDEYGFSTFSIRVTPTGDIRGFGIFIVLILCSLVCFVLGVALRLEWLGFLSGLLFIITGIYSMIYGIGDLSDLYTRTVALISIGLGMIFMTAAAWAFTHKTDY